MTHAYVLEHGGRTAIVDEVYVSPDWRGRGIGTRVLEVIGDEAAATGVRAIRLEVERHNHGAKALYDRHGFTDTKRLLMVKPLH
jgi:ribosomal protein S18 acetylase RimI-like enzyme